MKNIATAVLSLAAAAAFAAPIIIDEVMDKRIDESIEKGIEFLISYQRANGSYPEAHGEGGAISALAGMALLAKGYLPGPTRQGECINRCVDFILNIGDIREHDGVTGYYGARQEGNGKMYAHGICTLFMSEVSGMVDEARQARIDRQLPNAIKIILDAQKVRKNERDTGGWRYNRNSGDSDMSCSGWQLMALRSCRLNGGDVPSTAIQAAVEYVKRHHDAGQGHFVYQQGQGYAVTLTGAGILCLELCGSHNDPASMRAANFLLRSFRELESQDQRYYGMYYTAQGLFQIGGEPWKQFSYWMYNQWIQKQNGSGAWTSHGNEGTSPYCTAMMILAFTVPYRQLPIYQRDETVDEE
ncbi:MAG: terpene cyclase/mutase family protein [Kiritimatiellaeota bacterium]|nr:terpene cyclase/mutase family protein [Kiritimatiellota bacterium]